MFRTLLAIVGCLFLGASGALAQEGFPAGDLLPKREIGAARFLVEHPEYDGRGVTVAVFDTGVDPAAPGLQVTTEGKPKIVDIVDASGSGDVRTTTVREAIEGKLKGLTGRELTVPDQWNNPTGQYHLGMKPAYELFPRAVLPRVKDQRRKAWDKAAREALAEATRDLRAHQQEHPSLQREEKKRRKELEARVEQLNRLNKEWDDPGPIYDCVVFHDGEKWQAVVDTDEDGDLSDEKLMTNYRDQRQHATFGEIDLVTFVVNIYDEGNLLSIVTDAGTHGTHVAGIIAAHYPDRPELNGVAPGAQIVSVKIGDTRLGSRSLGTGEVRGLIAALENECDLINMSYGGPSPLANAGRFAELYSEIVNRYGVIFVASAGNNGPALSTVGSPGGTTSAILGVGAYVSPGLIESAYSLRESLDEMPFTWSSRGPTFDGDVGVDICAPGGAIAPVSRWALRPGQLMNGTSMSSPNACGGIALVLSALKQKQIEYTPELVKLAVKNTARELAAGDVFSNGRGLIQVDETFAWLLEHHEAVDAQVRYEVDLPDERTRRGVYLREADQVRRVHEVTVRVRPEFNEDAPFPPRADYQAAFRLECDAKWVDYPNNFFVHHGGRSFKILVDPRKLEPGVHYAEITAHDPQHPESGPRFRVPITVLVPKGKDAAVELHQTLSLEPGQIERSFVSVPIGATWANVQIRSTQADTQRLVILHALQRLEDQPYDAAEQKDYLILQPGQRRQVSFPVVENKTLELTLAQFWSSLGESEIEVTLTFHGIQPVPGTLVWDGGNPIHRVDMQAPLGPMRVKPVASLETLRRTLRPKESQIQPLQAGRDELPEGRLVYGLTLTYEFSLDEKTKLVPRTVITADEHGYERYASGLYTLYDKNKRPVKFGSSDDAVTLEKGDYTLTVFFRHEDRQRLKDIQNAAVWLDRELKSKPPIGVYDDYLQAAKGGRKFGAAWIRPGQRLPVYLTLGADDLPKGVAPGDVLLGKIEFGDEEAELGGASRRPGGFLLHFVVPPKPSEKPEDSAAEPKKEEPSLDDKLFEAKLAHLKTLTKEDDRQAFQELFEQLQEAKPEHLPLLQAKLEMLDDNDRKKHLPEVVKAANAVIKAIPKRQVRIYFASRPTPETDEDKQEHKEMTRLRDAWIDALYRKTRALAYMDLPPDPEHPENESIRKAPKDKEKRSELFEKAFEQLASWVDTTDKKYALLHVRRLRRNDRRAEALKMLDKMIEDDPAHLLLYKKRADLYGELGWDFAQEYENQWRKLRRREEFLPN